MILKKSDIVKKMKFPIGSLVISACLISLFNMLISLGLLAIFMLYFGLKIKLMMLLSLVYIFILLLFIVGISYFLCFIYLYFKDLVHIWNFILLIGFWLTPVMYSEKQIPFEYKKYYMINPLARIISHLRDAILNNYYSFEQTLITLIICLIIFFLGIFLFKKISTKFAERL
jgi:ABC-type polysaccharide/polyol phosphate export permease